ncbi:MAG: redoxin domain-containing protein [Desulfovibrionaceae bacterium]|nr:redoxin domain-containing protein [Desulfovibrionaceae bacterium]
MEGKTEEQHILAVGDDFPTCRVAVLNGDADREYLDLPEDARWLELSKLSARFVLIQLYNTLCSDCVAETKALTRFFRQVEADPVLRGRLKIIGLGVYDSNRAVVRFRKHYEVAYPLFSDKDGRIFECLGQAELPLAYLVQAEGDGTWVIRLIRRGYFTPDDTFLNVLKGAVIRADTID